MQIAERWTGGWVVALSAIGALALAPTSHPAPRAQPALIATLPPIPHADERVLLANRPTCIDPSTTFEDPYMQVLDHAQRQLQRCFDGDIMGVDLLVSIAVDGHVTAATNHPDPWTPTSRCIAHVVSGLTFPRAETGVAIRIPILKTGYK